MKALIVPNFSKYNARSIFGDVCRSFSRHGVEMLFSKALPEDLPMPPGSSVHELYSCLSSCDVIVCIGGDGTILDGASYSAVSGKPVMGVNAGRLGFLAQVEPNIVDHYLDLLAKKEYTIQHRFGLSATFSDINFSSIDFALNDIVLSKIELENIVDLELYCDGKLIDSYLADGLIVSTPTGSTAYSLSAGGPVIDPKLSTVTIVPICPHSVTSRPIVFSADRKISVCSPLSTVSVVADGRKRLNIPPKCMINIRPSKHTATFIDFNDFEFFEILKTKIKQRG